MGDKLLEMLGMARKEQNIASRLLCEGICTEDMYNKVERGERALDRMAIKRLLARLGVDNGSYENYLEYTDYMEWKVRMEIINAIEKQELIKAEMLLEKYNSSNKDARNSSRDNIQQQFCMFMKLQIVRHKNRVEYEENACKIFGEALKLTVPNIDKSHINNMLLSPVEFIMVIEYKRRKKPYQSVEDILKMYKEFFEYMEKAPFGKLSNTKLYPKLVTCLYEDISNSSVIDTLDNSMEIYKRLLELCDSALLIIKGRKHMYYLIELLEISIELRKFIKEYMNDANKKKRYDDVIEETELQLKTMKDLYEENNVSAYMLDDCYMYRESSIYCIPDVIKTRRKMKHMTQKALSDGLCDVKTLSREENGQVAIQKYIFREIFKRLGLYPDYINMGIVTGEKEAVELYEEIRYASNANKYNDVDELLSELKRKLENDKHPINNQVIALIESRNKWQTKRMEAEECINTLKVAIDGTVNLKDIFECDDQIFLTIREVTLIYQMSLVYKEKGQYPEAYNYIKKIWDYCKNWEEQGLEDGRIGIYEMISCYMSSLLGDLGRYDEANDIADKSIRLALGLRRGIVIHQSIYDKAWNNNKSKKQGFDYRKELKRCSYIAQLMGDVNDELFYKNMMAKL